MLLVSTSMNPSGRHMDVRLELTAMIRKLLAAVLRLIPVDMFKDALFRQVPNRHDIVRKLTQLFGTTLGTAILNLVRPKNNKFHAPCKHA